MHRTGAVTSASIYERKFAEKLTILNQRGHGILIRVYNIKKVGMSSSFFRRARSIHTHAHGVASVGVYSFVWSWCGMGWDGEDPKLGVCRHVFFMGTVST